MSGLREPAGQNVAPGEIQHEPDPRPEELEQAPERLAQVRMLELLERKLW